MNCNTFHLNRKLNAYHHPAKQKSKAAKKVVQKVVQNAKNATSR